MQPTALLDTDYFTRLGLECDPFAVDALPDFFFVGAQRRFFVQRAVHALYFSGATVLLLGADGIGKTRTLGEIEKELKDLSDICRIEATVLMNAAEIRTLLALALGLPSAVAVGGAELVHALENVRPTDGDPQPVLVAIDAAQLLSIETLAECAALIASAGGRLRLLLVGESDLAVAWQQTQAGAAEILELTPLDRNETADYVRTKLQAAGYREESPLSDAELDQLFAQSGGNFAAINALVPQLLQKPSQASSPVVRRIKALPILHIGLIAALLSGVILLVLYRGGSDSQSSSDVSSPSAAGNQLPQTPNRKKSADTNTVALQLPASAVPGVTAENPATTVPAPAKIPIPTPAAIQNKKSAAEMKSVTEKKAVTNQPALVEPSVAAESTQKSTPEKAKLEKSSDKIVATNTPSPSFSGDESDLLGFQSSNYVLQLMGAESKTTVDKFAKGTGKGLKLYYYRTQLRGKPWFIVVTGPYADKNAVQAALTKLPEAVRKQQPWPRTLANVQADIRAHSGR